MLFSVEKTIRFPPTLKESHYRKKESQVSDREVVCVEGEDGA